MYPLGNFFYRLKCIVALSGQRDFKQDPNMMIYHHFGVLLKILQVAGPHHTFHCIKNFPQGIQTYCFTGTTCHPNMLRNCNKSLDILDFYLLNPGCRTMTQVHSFFHKHDYWRRNWSPAFVTIVSQGQRFGAPFSPSVHTLWLSIINKVLEWGFRALK